MVKVVQNTNNQSLAQIKIKPNPVKIIKLPATAEGNIKVCHNLLCIVFLLPKASVEYLVENIQR